MIRLITKKDRQAMRQGWIDGRETEKYLDIEILRVDTPYIRATIWKGTAGNPFQNYSYKTVEQRELYIEEAKKNAEAREEYNKEIKEKRGTRLSEAAQTAKNIKNILIKKYPEIKFSVTSENFSMGNSVNVSWMDGMPESDIEGFLSQFQYGHFDGMTDCYEYSNSRDFSQAKFVSSNRTISKEKQNIIIQQLSELMGMENSDYAVIPDEYMVNVRGYVYNVPLSRLVYQISVNYDFTKGFHGVRRKMTDEGKEIINVFELY